jgi:hypothetical protein
MENIFLGAFVISLIYVIIIFLEMRYYQKDDKQVKDIVKEGLLVYFSVISGIFVMQQFKPEVEKIINEAPPLVFVDNPPF